MSKQLKFSKDARYEMAKGIECLYNATRITLGPKGRNVIIEQEFGSPQIVNDGVTIAKAISLPDRFMNMGSSVVIEAASKTNDVVGDGTTTAILLASNLILEGLKYIDKGVNPVMLQKGLQNLLPKIIEEIDRVSTPIDRLTIWPILPQSLRVRPKSVNSSRKLTRKSAPTVSLPWKNPKASILTLTL